MAEARLSDLIREERLKAGYSREQLSALTRVSCDFISAIEEEDWDALPAAVFCRGFLHIICRKLQIKDTKIIATCERLLCDREAKQDLSANNFSLNNPCRPKTGKKKLFLTSSILIAIGLFALFFHHLPPAYQIQPGHEQDQLGTKEKIPASPLQTGHPTDSGDAKPETPQNVQVVVEKPVQMKMSLDGSEETQKTLFLPQSYTFKFTQEGRFVIYDTSAVKIWFNGERVGDLARGGRQRTVIFKNKDAL